MRSPNAMAREINARNAPCHCDLQDELRFRAGLIRILRLRASCLWYIASRERDTYRGDPLARIIFAPVRRAIYQDLSLTASLTGLSPSLPLTLSLSLSSEATEARFRATRAGSIREFYGADIPGTHAASARERTRSGNVEASSVVSAGMETRNGDLGKKCPLPKPLRSRSEADEEEEEESSVQACRTCLGRRRSTMQRQRAARPNLAAL